MRRLFLFAALAASAVLLPAAAASAHTELRSSSPASGAVVGAPPAQVVLRFAAPVAVGPRAVRVIDAQGRRVDDGRLRHGGADLEIGLRPRLPRGTYTTVFEIVPDDGHAITDGVRFSVRRAGAAPAIASATAAHDVPVRAATGLQLGATALGPGLVIFLLACWRGAPPARARRLLAAAAVAGLVAGAASIALAGGVVLETRSGHVWLARAVVWLVFLALVAARAPARVLAVPAGLLVLAPALEGHSTTHGPAALSIGADAAHVLAMSAWLGGLAALLLIVPREARAAVLRRFSPLAMAAVATLAITGTIASVVMLTGVEQLWTTAYGREILVKVGLLGVLVALGALNRRRQIVPWALRAEAGLAAVVLVVTGILVNGAPPVP